ncbi:proteoglycan 4-like [Saccostrea echinata]|uniref:proteoglycan 4-like n=1 Tax=Saccostrea echinata TaxID=191078 RepID=UPI002A7EE69E|nr:proteoglycan 4-like [Saccostrea echinata]
MTQVCEMASVSQWMPNTVTRNFYLDPDDLNDSTDSRQQINSDIPPTRRRDILSFKRSLSDDKDGLSGNEKLGTRKDLAIRSSTDKLNGNNCDDNQDINKMGKDTLQNSSPDDGPSGNVITSHLRHVHSNPFFLHCGLSHPHGKIYDDQQKRKNSLQDESDLESGAEYGVNSGFVNKLRQKFTSLNQREASVNRFPARKFASVENLLETSEKISFEERTRPFSSNKSRTLKQDSNYVRRKPDLPKPPKPPKGRTERKASDSVIEQKQHKPLHSEHEAPDINKIGRNDIIIIEHPKPSPVPKPAKKEETPTKMNGKTVKALKDKKVPDELPKPNTVSSFRSMFEKNNTSVSRKLLPDAPKVVPPKPSKPSKLKVNHKEAVEGSPISSPINKSPEVKKEKPKDIEAEKTEMLVKPSTIKERAQETPRILDSPVTRKKTYPEKKSIFDSDFNIKSEVEPIVRSNLQKSKVETTKVEETSSEPSCERDVKTEEKIFVKLKPVNMVNDKNFQNEKSRSLANKAAKNNEYFPGRKEIFDSSIIPKSPRQDSKENLVNTVNDKTGSPSPKSTLSEEIFPGRKQIFESSQISPSPTISNMSKKKRAPKPPASSPSTVTVKSPAPSMPVEKSLDPVVNDVVKISVIDPPSVSTSSVVPEKQESTNTVSSLQTSSPITPRTQPKQITELSESSPAPWQTQQKTSTKSSKVEKEEIKEETEKVNNFTPIEVSSSNDNTPTRGLPSVIANRLKKNSKNASSSMEENDKAESSDDDDGPQNLVKPSQLRNKSFVKVSNSPSVPNTPNSVSPSESQNSNTNVPVRNIEDLIRKNRDKPAALFDSSSIVPKVQPKVNGVPPLDLSDLVTEEQNHPYQEGYIPTKIKPCNIVFVGAGVSLDTQPLKKSRSGHSLRIQFDDKALSTHEYQSENSALAQYLEENPHEKEEVVKEQVEIEQATLSLDVDNTESSDDVESPRESSAMKSNTAIGTGSGELSNYKSKIQLDEFQFGMSMEEPEPVPTPAPDQEVNAEEGDLCPAEDESSINFTATGTSDIMF